MIHEIEIQNFGCIHNATVHLTRFHAFVGPNGAGKTRFLEAAVAVLTLARLGSGANWFRGLVTPHAGMRLFAKTERGTVRVTATEAEQDKIVYEVEKEDPSFAPIPEMLLASNLKRLDQYRVSLRDLLVVEHPENDLYPSAIAPMMSGLRALSERAQVLITTHSPLVLNEMQPNEVTLVRRDPKTDASEFTPIAETTNFADRLRVYALGELWVSYLDKIYDRVPGVTE